MRKGFREHGCLGGGEPAGVHEVFHHEVGIWRHGAAYGDGGSVDRGGEEEAISKAAGFEQGKEAIAAEYGAQRRSRHRGRRKRTEMGNLIPIYSVYKLRYAQEIQNCRNNLFISQIWIK